MNETNLKKECFIMDEKEKSIVEIVNCNITRFACDLGYSYLNAGDIEVGKRKG